MTGLEDILQDNVKECIERFREADIKIWLLTGDKFETVKEVSKNCGVVDEAKHNVVEIDSVEQDDIEDSLDKFIEDEEQLLESGILTEYGQFFVTDSPSSVENLKSN